MPWHVCFSLFVCVGDTGDLGWYALSSIHRRKQQTDPTDAERACTVDGRATCPIASLPACVAFIGVYASPELAEQPLSATCKLPTVLSASPLESILDA